MGEGAGMMVSVAVLAALAVAHHRPHRPLPLRRAAAALGVAVWALLTVIFPLRAFPGPHVAFGRGGRAGGLAVAAGGFALLLSAAAANRAPMPRPLPCAGPGVRR